MQKLSGVQVRLESLSHAHASDLWKNTGGDSELWKWVLVKFPIPTSESEMKDLISKMLAESGTREAFVVIDLRSGEAVGSTSYLDIHPELKALEIGSTFYGEAARRTHINTEAKLLLLTEAFEARGCERVALKADNLNERSLRAMERIGAKREGVLRKHQLRRDGSLRDTVYFSIIKSEWPEVKANLLSKLAN